MGWWRHDAFLRSSGAITQQTRFDSLHAGCGVGLVRFLLPVSVSVRLYECAFSKINFQDWRIWSSALALVRPLTM